MYSDHLVVFTSCVLQYPYSLLIMETLKTVFYLSVRWVRLLKSDRKGKLYIFPYLSKRVSYSINVRNLMSEYFHVKEYSDIHMIVSQIFCHLYEYSTKVFNIRVSVSIDTKLYTCGIRAYNIEYFSVL